MANIAPRYHDALGCPGRTGRVNEIGGVLRARAERPRVDFRRTTGVLGIGQKTFKSPSRAGCRKLRGESGGGQEAPGFGVRQANGDALSGGVRVERKPGGAGLRDRDLRDQNFVAARHPEANGAARTNPFLQKAAGDCLRFRIDLGIGKLALHRDHRDGGRMAGGGCGKDLAEQFVADQIRPRGAAQNRAGGKRQTIVIVPGNLRRCQTMQHSDPVRANAS